MTEFPPAASPSSLTPPHATSQVPALFAEKAMASLMQLHGELMEEKERRVDLYRRLMEKEQAVSELRMYVRMLEEKLGVAPTDSAPPSAHPVTAEPSPPPATHQFTTARPAPSPSPKVVEFPRRSNAQVRPAPVSLNNDGWKAW